MAPRDEPKHKSPEQSSIFMVLEKRVFIIIILIFLFFLLSGYI
jgi:hypothetical protein